MTTPLNPQTVFLVLNGKAVQTEYLKQRKNLARNLRRLRQNYGLSQEGLAYFARLHRTYVGSVERAERNISIDNISKLAKTLGVTPSALLAEK